MNLPTEKLYTVVCCYALVAFRHFPCCQVKAKAEH